jgi:hypothetical protein
VLLSLLAFVLQVYLAQTHIHGLTAYPAAGPGITQTQQAPAKPGKLPPLPDKLDCPLCQIALHAGTFVLPAALAVLPVTLTVSLLPVDLDPTETGRQISHRWQSRAPPHHR